MEDQSLKAMMYWSSLFQDNDSELENKINDQMLDRSKKQMITEESDNPLVEEQVLTKPVETSENLDQAMKTTKLLKNLFAPSKKNAVNAEDFTNWKQNKERFMDHVRELDEDTSERKDVGGLLGGNSSSTGYQMSEGEIEAVMNNLETKLVEKMDLPTLLSDDELAQSINAQMPMVETLLMQKGNLSGKILKNAKFLIKRYVRKLAEEFKPKIKQSIKKVRDPDVVPKRTFRNLNLSRTIWMNLPNYDVRDRKLYVNQLYFHRASQKRLPSKLIVVVDQSGSMVSTMVQTTILASIFASLPNVDVELFAFDTTILNLTKYVSDPFEVLMQTKLGGGTHINFACQEAMKSITDPKRTGFILITDYFEGGNQMQLFNTIKSIKENGSAFVSVGPMDIGGRAYINSHFVKELETIDITTIIGGIDNLIDQIADVI